MFGGFSCDFAMPATKLSLLGSRIERTQPIVLRLACAEPSAIEILFRNRKVKLRERFCVVNL